MANKKNDGRKIAIYARKSVFTGKGESTKNQIEACKRKISLTFPDTSDNDLLIYEDEGFTGYNTKRPGFQNMLKDIRDNKIRAITFYKLDRISRNVSDFTSLREELDNYDVSLLSATENIENVTPSGKAMLLMISVFAQLERDTIAERIRDNMLELAKTGRWLGGTSPTGYQSKQIEKITLDGKTRKLFMLTAVENEAQEVKQLYEKMQELQSLTKLTDWALGNGLKTRQGNFYSRFSLKRILTNPVYAKADGHTLNYFRSFGIDIYADEKDFDGKHGLMVYNKSEKKETRKIPRDIEEWIVSIGKHEGLIDGEDWVEVQKIIKGNGDMKYRKPTSTRALLSGIMRCSHCGAFMRPKLRSGAKLVDGKRPFDYICELKDQSKKKLCQCPNLNGLEADKLVLEVIKSLKSSESDYRKAIEQKAKEKFSREDKKEAELKSLNFQIQKNDNSISSLLNRIKYIDIDLLDDIQNEIKKLKKDNENLEGRIKEISANDYEEINDSETAKIVLGIMDSYLDVIDNLNLNQKRLLIKTLVSSIETDGKDIYIQFIGGRKITPTDNNHGGSILSSQFPTCDSSITGGVLLLLSIIRRCIRIAIEACRVIYS